MPMGMVSLLTAPLVADSAGEDSVSLSTTEQILFILYLFVVLSSQNENMVLSLIIFVPLSL